MVYNDFVINMNIIHIYQNPQNFKYKINANFCLIKLFF